MKDKEFTDIYLIMVSDLETGHILQTEVVGGLLNHIKTQVRFQVLSEQFLRNERRVFYG